MSALRLYKKAYDLKFKPSKVKAEYFVNIVRSMYLELINDNKSELLTCFAYHWSHTYGIKNMVTAIDLDNIALDAFTMKEKVYCSVFDIIMILRGLLMYVSAKINHVKADLEDAYEDKISRFFEATPIDTKDPKLARFFIETLKSIDEMLPSAINVYVGAHGTASLRNSAIAVVKHQADLVEERNISDETISSDVKEIQKAAQSTLEDIKTLIKDASHTYNSDALKTILKNTQDTLKSTIDIREDIEYNNTVKLLYALLELYCDVENQLIIYTDNQRLAKYPDEYNAIVMQCGKHLEILKNTICDYGCEIIYSNPGDKYDGIIHKQTVNAREDDISTSTTVNASLRIGFKYRGKILHKETVLLNKLQ